LNSGGTRKSGSRRWLAGGKQLKKGRWTMASQIAKDIGTGSIDRVEGSGASMVILIAMVILFGGAAYFTGRLYGKVGMYTVIAGFVLVVATLMFMGGLTFG
jgi:hypothetical protein